MRLLPRSRFGKSAALLLGAGVFWLLYTAARTQILLGNGRILGARAATFARDSFVGEANAPTLTYLALGDSTAAGWGAQTVAETYPHQIARAVAARGFRVHLVNVAVGGATTRDVAAIQIAQIDRLKPDLITLSVGANDATHFTDAKDYRREWSAILTKLDASGARTILVADTPDMFLAPALPLPMAAATAGRARAQNFILRALVKNPRVQIVELHERGKLKENAMYAADLFHPSAAGYARWAQLFIERTEEEKSERAESFHKIGGLNRQFLEAVFNFCCFSVSIENASDKNLPRFGRRIKCYPSELSFRLKPKFLVS